MHVSLLCNIFFSLLVLPVFDWKLNRVDMLNCRKTYKIRIHNYKFSFRNTFYLLLCIFNYIITSNCPAVRPYFFPKHVIIASDSCMHRPNCTFYKNRKDGRPRLVHKMAWLPTSSSSSTSSSLLCFVFFCLTINIYSKRKREWFKNKTKTYETRLHFSTGRIFSSGSWPWYCHGQTNTVSLTSARLHFGKFTMHQRRPLHDALCFADLLSERKRKWIQS